MWGDPGFWSLLQGPSKYQKIGRTNWETSRIFGKIHIYSIYPLVNIQKAIENGHRSSGFTHEKWWFSIVMWLFTRGYCNDPMANKILQPLQNQFPVILGNSDHGRRKVYQICREANIGNHSKKSTNKSSRFVGNLLHFSSSLGCSPIPPIPGRPNEGGSMGEFIAVKLTIQFPVSDRWPFQDPIDWRYLPYIRPIFEA